jgi:hypothetical protein
MIFEIKSIDGIGFGRSRESKFPRQYGRACRRAAADNSRVSRSEKRRAKARPLEL